MHETLKQLIHELRFSKVSHPVVGTNMMHLEIYQQFADLRKYFAKYNSSDCSAH